MSNIQRICPACGSGNAMSSQFCERCGQDFERTGNTLPARRSSLPVVASTAALPLLAGAASLAVRAGWRLLQAHLREQKAQVAPRQAAGQSPKQESITLAPAQSLAPSTQSRRTIRIRSTWVVGGPDGIYRHGASDHTIEIDD